MARMKMKNELHVEKYIYVEGEKFLITIDFTEPDICARGSFDYSDVVYKANIYRNFWDFFRGKRILCNVNYVKATAITNEVMIRIQEEIYDYILRKMNYYKGIKQMTEQLEESGWDCTLL